MRYDNVLELKRSNYFEVVFNSLVVETHDHFGRVENYKRMYYSKSNLAEAYTDMYQH